MTYTSEQIARIKAERPNLCRVACELASFKDPYKIIDILLPLVGPMLKQDLEGEQS